MGCCCGRVVLVCEFFGELLPGADYLWWITSVGRVRRLRFRWRSFLWRLRLFLGRRCIMPGLLWFRLLCHLMCLRLMLLRLMAGVIPCRLVVRFGLLVRLVLMLFLLRL